MRYIVNSSIFRLAVFTLITSVLLGCQTPGPYIPDGDPHPVEDENPVVLLDEGLKRIIAIDHLQSQRTSDGRLKVLSTMRNKKKYRQHVQIQTVFKDGNHFSLGEDSAWNDVILFENETRTYTTSSFSPNAQYFTIRIRLPR